MRKKIIPLLITCSFFSGCVTTKNSDFGNSFDSLSKNLSDGANKVTGKIKETFASEDPCSNNSRNLGLLIGATAGVVVGSQIDSGNSKLVGLAAGAALGGLIGVDMDRRRCELSKIAKNNDLKMSFNEIKFTESDDKTTLSNKNGSSSKGQEVLGLSVSVEQDKDQFESNSSRLTPKSAKYFDEIAKQYSYTEQRKKITKASSKEEVESIELLKNKKIMLVGHTDDLGSSNKNADLSEVRAKEVAKIFEKNGIAKDRIFFQGAGEALPVAKNITEDGRSKNRRVEIVDVTDEKALKKFLQNRNPDFSLYRKKDGEQTEANVKKEIPKTAVLSKPVNKNQDIRASKDSIKNDSGFIDFGGSLVNHENSSVTIGSPLPSASSFSIISNAYADDVVSGSCLNDRPRVMNGVKSLKTNQDYSTGEFMPGLYGTSWVDKVNGHLVAINNVNVLRDGGVPVTKPNLLIYSNYVNSKQKPTFRDTPDVNVYRGEKGVLYRIFSKDKVSCLDMVIPYKSETASSAKIYYPNNNVNYVSVFKPTIVK